MKKIAILLGFCLVVALLPTFMPQPVSAMTGSGTAGDPYVISNVTDLQDIEDDLDAYYVLNNSIDASGTSTWNWDAGRGVYEGFAPISTFTGNFNGNNYTISGLFEDRNDLTAVGLFGTVSGGTVQYVKISGANISGYFASTAPAIGVGVVVGVMSSGTVQYVYVTGVVEGTANDSYGGNGHSHAMVGGIVGYMTGGTLGRSAADVDVTAIALQEAVSMAGGLVGELRGGAIGDCYAKGSTTASYDAYPLAYGGGAIGYHLIAGTMDNCYATGDVSALTHGGLVGYEAGGAPACTDSFWDTQTSGEATSACGSGKATAEMKTQSTFIGWDFDTIWDIGGSINDGYPYLQWWYNPPDIISDVNQVVWFQPNTIIESVILPNRAQSGTLQDGEFTWGANPAGITISHGELMPEEEYDFEPVIPGGQDIINPEPETMTGDVDTERLHSNPLYPLVQVLSIGGFLNERLVWLGLAWFILIAAMFGVHLGFDTRKDTEKPQHFILTTITGLGLSIMFYTMGIFPWWVILLMAFGLIGAIIWERQPVL